jgi:hypothetical protein
MITISFPGGAGGNWLRCLVEEEVLSNQQINFHTHNSKKRWVNLMHELNTEKFDYLLSGKYYYNFFVNVIYKFFHIEEQFTQLRVYKDYYTDCVNTARYLCQFENIKDHIFFNFDDLINNDRNFYNKILTVLPNLDLSYADFIIHKNLFFSTMVETNDSYENFDNPFWVSFVLGQLMNHNIVPDNFSIYDKKNQLRSSEFAKQNYHHCKLTSVHHFKSKVFLPNLL